MNTTPPTEFSQLMTRAGLGIAEVARVLGVHDRTVRRHMKGEAKRIDTLKLETLRAVANMRCPGDRSTGFRFVDLFAGIGGLRRPFEEIGGRCVFTSEWDRFCQQTYAANFPEPADSDHRFVGDIRPCAEDPESVPPHDVLLAGFPCQPFSIAGVSKKNALGRPHGFLCDTQGTLFYDLAKIIAHHRPPVFLLENVRNLERHDRGKTFATIMHVLEEVELGYTVHIPDRGLLSMGPPEAGAHLYGGVHGGYRIRLRCELGCSRRNPARRWRRSWSRKLIPNTPSASTCGIISRNTGRGTGVAGNGFGYSLFGPR